MRHIPVAFTIAVASAIAVVWGQADGPLMLGDEPLRLADEELADNSRCHVCHLNYAQEEIALAHAAAGMGCPACHGDCDEHIADESWAEGGNGTAPGIMYAREDVNALCAACHPEEDVAEDCQPAFAAEEHCTDCHGDHRLRIRKLKWRDAFPALLLADHTSQKLVLYSNADGVVWSQEAEALFDAWVRPNGHIVYTTRNTVVEVVPDLERGEGGEVLWTYQLGSGADAPEGVIYSCQPLADGGVLVVESGTFRLVELDAAGQVRKAIPIPRPTVGDPQDQLRLARRTPDGTYLVAYFAEGVFRELGADGRTLRVMDVKPHCDGEGDSAYEAIPLENGNILISCGPQDRVIELSADGERVWSMDTDELRSIDMRWVTSLERLPNGNTVICNYAKSTSHVKAFEVTPDKRVIWQLGGRHVQGLTRLQVLGADYRPDG